MSATVVPIVLSGSAGGQNIPVTGVAIGAATTIHTVGATQEDVELWAVNVGTNPETVTICPGGVTDPGDKVPFPVLPNIGPKYLGKFRLSATKVLKAFATTTAVINIYGGSSKYVP